MNNIDEYAEWTWTTWKERKDNDKHHAAFGFLEEAGEVAGVFKREERGEGFDQEKFMKEMGDAIYYWCRCCINAGVLPSQVLAMNKRKLMDRLERGVLTGSGDNR